MFAQLVGVMARRPATTWLAAKSDGWPRALKRIEVG